MWRTRISLIAAVPAVLVGIGILVSFFVRDLSLENPYESINQRQTQTNTPEPIATN
jgi:hypothetical protein